MPVGWDTPRYLDQVGLVATRGLTHVPTSLPFPSSTLASRAGFPVLVLSLAGALHTSTFVTAATIPPSVAVAIALAAGAFLSWSLRGDHWTFGLAAHRGRRLRDGRPPLPARDLQRQHDAPWPW